MRNEMRVKDCIGNPVFISVVSNNGNDSLFVIEVDIEPASCRCADAYFLLNRKKGKEITAKNIEKDFKLFVREGSSTKMLNELEQRLFVELTLTQNIEQRENYETLELNQHIQSIEQPMEKLRILLCKGTGQLDKSIWPLLVVSKPSEDQKNDQEFRNSMRFLRSTHFHAVIDFDNFSNANGISSWYRNEEKSEIYTNEIFQDYAGRQTELEEKLGIPIAMKTIWIFANGREDMVPKTKHMNRIDWSENYSTGIKDAILFFSKIIASGRALIIFLIFSSDFDGFIETFYECTTRFGWKQVLIISADEDNMKQFHHMIVKESKGTEENMRMCSVSGTGTKWEHVCATFLEATGHDDCGSVFLPTTSGALVEVEPFIQETMSDLKLLSSKQCENSVKAKSVRDTLRLRCEEEFYKGGKVTWYNFYYHDQVLERSCLSSLCETIDRLMTSNDKVGKRMAIVTIAHEPGAGGTTLAHNVLWRNRKKYRCATITKITERTIQNIMTLWKYKEKTNPKPVLLLIDELAQSDYIYEDLVWQINKECRATQSQSGIICCLLVCQKETDISRHTDRGSQSFPEINEFTFPLCQHLTDEEQIWMEDKFKQIEQRDAKGNPEHLISFMILRKGFNENYITQTITEFLKMIDTKSNEFELLEYVSLVCAFASTSLRGANAFIPVECCDDLLGRRFKKAQLWQIWEKSLSHYLKIFLVIEQKENASGMEIRMSHPALAMPVLCRILEVRNVQLSDLTIRFLNSTLFTCSPYGKEILKQLTKEMLTRRLKEEYNDNKNTNYSPLIEEILNESDWQNATKVLQKGVSEFQDCYMCQTLARLYSKKAKHKEAVEWSRKAEQYISNQMEKGSWHHNLGTVLREQFQCFLNLLPDKINATASSEMITIILEAIQHFVEARKHLGRSSEIRLLYTSQDVIKTINICAKFITENVRFTSDVEVKKLLTDTDYIPTELSHEWRTFKPKFLHFLKYADESFDCIESYLCYYTIFYAHNPNKLHRFHNQLHYKFPETRAEFSKYLGEESEHPPESEIPEQLNIWHRRRLIHLMGNTYMNMYDILLQVKKRVISRDHAITKCLEIKRHLSGITNRQPRDLINLVAANFLIGMLNGRNRDSWNDVLKYCKDILRTGHACITQAYFFISILLWPCKVMDVEYDDELFYTSLKHLNKNKQKKIEKHRGIINTNLILKEERNITKPTAQFFLTDKDGMDKVCHRFDIFNRGKPDADEEFDKKGMWERMAIKSKLKRLQGQIQNKDGRTHVIIKNEKSGKEIEISKIRGGNDVSS